MAHAYTVGLLRAFVAEHRLIGGDWGKENERHSHPYRIEVVFEGDALDAHGYLIDISVIEPRLDALCARYRGSMLNDLPEFAGKNPGIEQFASIFAERLAPDLARSPVRALTIKVWESDTAYATCRRPVG
ncbi:MAG TPA: 6-carboxytetrahydropterin synthase [Polyangia bacterium]|jgi:6-pyruvoyltetrahydropterin/6-carboxytetrahydropterin synthase|nr:6-carboxytetrahydropterin synthase [Polyangia bacterium]